MSAKQAQQAEFQDAGVPVAFPYWLVDAAGFARDGTTATPIAAGTAANTIIKGGPGRLCRILVTTAGSAAVSVFDNASAASGPIIGGVAANVVAGTLVECQAPAQNGITVQGNAANPAMTVIWS